MADKMTPMEDVEVEGAEGTSTPDVKEEVAQEVPEIKEVEKVEVTVEKSKFRK